MVNPLTPFLDEQGVVVLDGGLATELEARGCALDSALWSARVLIDDPELIRQVHLDYLRAGADCITAASYQASLAGFERLGMTRAEAGALLSSSVRLACEARDAFWRVPEHREGRLRPLVAASVGPYGAFLADGSEYSGRYDTDLDGLLAFHRERWHLLADAGADLLACETIPSGAETRALAVLLAERPDVWAWIAFCCRDGRRLGDGTPLADAVDRVAGRPQVAAVGINCTAPRFVADLVAEVRSRTTKPIVVYPNSGEGYDADAKRWVGDSVAARFGAQSVTWHRAGAALVGGCCRTGPGETRAIRAALVSRSPGT